MSVEDPTGWCQHCGGTFRYRLVHNGFGNSAYAYCDDCSFTVLLSEWSPAAKRVPFQSQRRITPDLECLLKPCPCGGKYLASADPNCPNCAQALDATNYIEKNGYSVGLALGSVVVRNSFDSHQRKHRRGPGGTTEQFTGSFRGFPRSARHVVPPRKSRGSSGNAA